MTLPEGWFPLAGEVAHLTWSVERDPKWPSTDRYESLAEFIKRWHGDV
jgi:hypothetical protein